MTDKERTDEKASPIGASDPRNGRSDGLTGKPELPSTEKEPAPVLSNSRFSSEHVWATVGKIGALLGVLIALFTLGKSIWPSGPKIVAHCQAVHGALPPPSIMLANLELSTDPLLASSRIEDALSKMQPTSKLTDLERTAIATAIVALLSRPDSKIVDDTEAPSDLLQCEITNNGDEPAREVMIDLPDVPSIAMLDRANLPLTNGQRSVSLGIIRPGTNFNLRFWFSDFWGIHPVQISDDRGKGDVVLLNSGSSFPGPLARFVIYWEHAPWFFYAMLVLAVLTIVSLAQRIRSRRKAAHTEGGG